MAKAQYTSHEFARFCADKQIRASVGRTGVCWDNAAAESFFATLKNEMYHRQRFDRLERRQQCLDILIAEVTQATGKADRRGFRTHRNGIDRPDGGTDR